MPPYNPLVSVIMPVYKSDEYLEDAIVSIINQTFRDFEFIIVCDDPTDRSKAIISRYQMNDDRIKVVYQKHEGLVAALNKGCSLARGKYIARMDADDISLSERFEKQVAFMEAHPGCSLVGTFVEWINESGQFLGYWSIDITTKTAAEIRNTLPQENCIAHPSVVIRRSVFNDYHYDHLQKNAEDYDLWLRMASDNHLLCKLPEFLLKLRIHHSSVMSTRKREAPGSDKIHCKIRYLNKKLCAGKISFFDLSVFFYLLINLGIWPIRRIQLKLDG